MVAANANLISYPLTMAQQRRMIYDSLYANPAVNMLPVEARYLYIGTIVLADDDGKVRADPRYLRGRLFSFDEKITSNEVKKWTDQLSEIGQILLYQVGEEHFLKHPNWKKYQRIRADMRSPSKLPNPLRNRNEDVTEPLLNINQDKTNQDKIATESVAFSLKDEIKKLEDSPRRDLNIIALYFEHRKPDLRSYEQFQAALQRHLRAAKSLKPFENPQILKALGQAKREYGDSYTLETLLKLLTK